MSDEFSVYNSVKYEFVFAVLVCKCTLVQYYNSSIYIYVWSFLTVQYSYLCSIYLVYSNPNFALNNILCKLPHAMTIGVYNRHPPLA